MTTFPASQETASIEPIGGNAFARVTKKAAGAIVSGNVLISTITTGALQVATAADVGPFFVASRDGASADTTISVFGTGAYAWVVSNGVIHPNNTVVADTGGLVKAWVAETYDKIVGVYLHKAGEGDPNHPPTDAAAADRILIRLGGGKV